MGIQAFIARNLPQKAVYWGNPKNNGTGGYTYDDPIEIDCRWEEMTQIVTELNGEMILSRAVVYTVRDLEENGRLYLGTLDSLLDSSGESSGDIDLSELEEAYIIKRYGKTPALNSTTDFLRKSYLTPFLT